VNDIYPEEFRNQDDQARDEEIAILRKTLVVKRLTLYLVGLVLLVAVIGLVVLGFMGYSTIHAVRHTQQLNSPIARDTHGIAQYVKECQDPQSECSRENREALAKALAGIDQQNKRVTAAGASCSLGVPIDLSPHARYVLIKRCIERTLGQ
jgi:hypothetical protein